MSLTPISQIRIPSGLTPAQIENIANYLQGAVYCWCNNKPDEWFSIRDLGGRLNFNWSGTPLSELYSKHRLLGKSDVEAIKAAGNDAGWLLKYVIHRDQRKFILKKEALVNHYKWIK